MKIFNLIGLFLFFYSFIFAEPISILTGQRLAKVYVNEEQRGTGEVVKLDLQPGVYFFKVTAPDGSVLFKQKASVIKGEVLTLLASQVYTESEGSPFLFKSSNTDDLLKKESWYAGFFLAPVGGFSIGKSTNNQFASYVVFKKNNDNYSYGTRVHYRFKARQYMLPFTAPSLGLMGEAVFFASVGFSRGRYGTTITGADWFYNVFESGIGVETNSKDSIFSSIIQVVYYNYFADSGRIVSSYDGNGITLSVASLIKF